MEDSMEGSNNIASPVAKSFASPPIDPPPKSAEPSLSKADRSSYRKLRERVKAIELILNRPVKQSDVDSDSDPDNEKQQPTPDPESEEPFSIEHAITYVSSDMYHKLNRNFWDKHSFVVVVEPHAATATVLPRNCPAMQSEKINGVDPKPDDKVFQDIFNSSCTVGGIQNDTIINQFPTRLIMRSEALEEEINRITGTVQRRNQLRPFRSLVHFEKQFRQRLEISEKICESTNTKVYPDLSESGEINKRSRLPSTSGTTDEHELKFPNAEVNRARRVRNGLRCLVHFLHVDLKDIMEVRQQIGNGDLLAISFDHLTFLFNTGEQIIMTQPKNQLYRVLQVCGGRRFISPRRDTGEANYNPRAKISNLIIDAFYIDFDGTQFRAAPKQITIYPYDGLRKVTSLEAYPLRFYPSMEKEEIRLTARGERFVHSIRDMHKKYKGLTIKEGDKYVREEEIDSDVIIDFEFAFRKSEPLIAPPLFDGGVLLQPTRPSSRECWPLERTNDAFPGVTYEDDQSLNTLQVAEFSSNTDLLNPRPLSRMSKDHLMLLPYRIYGYVLLSRKWFPLDVELVEDIRQVKEDDADGFDDLVLPEGHGDVVRALINMHLRAPQADSFGKRYVEAPTRHTDIVKGKGKGLIILLHGAPGVGKTSTAECVAVKTGRPLFSITCGDISGASVKAVEQNLEGYFDLARKWGCVLLLDEADVFLGERTKGDINQNSLVSVFLRALEYYSGILILTTNRIGEFDEAIKSRVHCSLYYPPLDRANTMKIWENNLGRLSRGNKKNLTAQIIDFKSKDIMGFAKKHWKSNHRWNGRQIKNAFQTAVALAEWDYSQANSASNDKLARPLLLRKNFETVAAASAHFDMYLQQVRTSDQQRARTRELRRDDFMEVGVVDRHPMEMNPREIARVATAHRKTTYRTIPNSDSEHSNTSSDSDQDSDEDINRSKARLQEELERLDRDKKKRLKRENAGRDKSKRSSKKEKGRRDSPPSGEHKTHRTERLTVDSANSDSGI
ncbi:hypothetical protein MMC11_004593 [Xylographa trunciseda]|nr:hypothetical protein [Xylographa trunciseda]